MHTTKLAPLQNDQVRLGNDISHRANFLVRLRMGVHSQANRRALRGTCIDCDIAGRSNLSLLICEEMDKEVPENHTTVTPVHSEEEFADLLENAEWTPVSGSGEQQQQGEGGEGGGGSTEPSTREGWFEFIFPSNSTPLSSLLNSKTSFDYTGKKD